MIRRALLAAAAILTGAVLVSWQSGASAFQQPKVVWDFQEPLAWSPDGQFIAFTGITDGKYRIYQVKAAPGSTPVPLVPLEGNQASPTWSPDGKTLAFSIGGGAGSSGIYVAQADGSGARKLVDGAITPSWSPDGKWIAYGAKDAGKYQVFVMAPDGQGQRKLTQTAAANFNPAWSPDSASLVFESDRNGDGKDELYRISVNGTDERLLHQDNDANLVYPSFGRDGQEVFFAAVANRNGDSYVMTVDGANAHLVRTHTGPARWSAKAGRLAFVAYDENKLNELFIAQPDGTNPVAITSLNHTRGSR